MSTPSRILPRLVAAVLVGASACTAALFSPPGTVGGVGGMAAAPSSPSHPPATAAQWTAAEADAARAAKTAGGVKLDAPVRIHETGFVAQHHVALAAGRCYHAGVGWSFDAPLQIGVSFDPGTNVTLAGNGQRFARSGRALDFCADHPGGATLTFSAIPSAGAINNHELLEYALVIGSAPETASARVARRAVEAKQAKQARDAEVASAAISAQEKADDAGRKCHECTMNYQMCRGGDCRRSFDLCAHDNSYTDLAEHPEVRPCGTP